MQIIVRKQERECRVSPGADATRLSLGVNRTLLGVNRGSRTFDAQRYHTCVSLSISVALGPSEGAWDERFAEMVTTLWSTSSLMSLLATPGMSALIWNPSESCISKMYHSMTLFGTVRFVLAGHISVESLR